MPGHTGRLCHSWRRPACVSCTSASIRPRRLRTFPPPLCGARLEGPRSSCFTRRAAMAHCIWLRAGRRPLPRAHQRQPGATAADHIVAIFEQMAAQFPGAEVRASTLDAFAGRFGPRGLHSLSSQPNWAATWVYGLGSDPHKVCSTASSCGCVSGGWPGVSSLRAWMCSRGTCF